MQSSAQSHGTLFCSLEFTAVKYSNLPILFFHLNTIFNKISGSSNVDPPTVSRLSTPSRSSSSTSQPSTFTTPTGITSVRPSTSSPSTSTLTGKNVDCMGVSGGDQISAS